jgi:hypothetical protein
MERCIEWGRLQRSLGGFTSVTGYAIRRPGEMLWFSFALSASSAAA